MLPFLSLKNEVARPGENMVLKPTNNTYPHLGKTEDFTQAGHLSILTAAKECLYNDFLMFLQFKNE